MGMPMRWLPIIDRRMQPNYGLMTDPVEQALAHLGQLCTGETDGVSFPITLNFHPDIAADGENVIELLARHGTYRSQFETGTSSGGLTAYRGGDRWSWESRIFGGAYDDGAPSFRPKYGAMNHRNDPVGGSRRFGSSHIRLRPHVRSRASFCYPDSHLEPQNFAVGDVRPLIALAEANASGLDPWLDNYIEAHVHGPLRISEDVEAVVLDPSFRSTAIEEFCWFARLPGGMARWFPAAAGSDRRLRNVPGSGRGQRDRTDCREEGRDACDPMASPRSLARLSDGEMGLALHRAIRTCLSERRLWSGTEAPSNVVEWGTSQNL